MNWFHLFVFCDTKKLLKLYKNTPHNKHFASGEKGGGRGQEFCGTIDSPLEIRAKNRSKNKLVRKNNVTRAHGICLLRVMGSRVVLTLHYNGITDKCPVCHLLLIILKSKFESKFK